MNVGIAQINTTIGNFIQNSFKIRHAYENLVQQGADFIVFPELTLCGYSPRDLLFEDDFVARNERMLRTLAASIEKIPALIGFVECNSSEKGRLFFNSAAWCQDGKVKQMVRKSLLPNYDVFDEDRYFQAAHETTSIAYKGKRIGLTICEDLWTHPSIPTARLYRGCGVDLNMKIPPIEMLYRQGIDCVINLSASPWHYKKQAMREGIMSQISKKYRVPLVYCNLIGGNDELIFDGQSFSVSRDGNIVQRLKSFEEDLAVVNIDLADTQNDFKRCLEIPLKTSCLNQYQEKVDNDNGVCDEVSPPWFQNELNDEPFLYDNEKILKALVLGLRDYAEKTGFKKGIIGLSGGIDSAVVACIAQKALGPENVLGISLPSAISSEHSKTDAIELAHNLGIAIQTLPIEQLVLAAENALEPIQKNAHGLQSIVLENIQARCRGVLMMAASNENGALVLATGNKSELAVGYCTLYGDMCGGLSVIGDLFKTQVYRLAHHLNAEKIIIPESTLRKPPSAELRPNQKDQDTLPDYAILDAILQLYIEARKSEIEIVQRGYSEALVRDIIRRVKYNEYKRKQAAPCLKVSPLSFGIGRRIPIARK